LRRTGLSGSPMDRCQLMSRVRSRVLLRRRLDSHYRLQVPRLLYRLGNNRVSRVSSVSSMRRSRMLNLLRLSPLVGGGRSGLSAH
jgi:hypothetical protein